MLLIEVGAGHPDFWIWLLLPWDGATHHKIPQWMAWHARLMVLAWAILLPTGVVIARYFKVTSAQKWPQVLDNPWWWHGHRYLQSAGILIATTGLLLAWIGGVIVTPRQFLHATLGWTVMALGWIQIVNALLRGSKGGPTDVRGLRGDHFDMTKRRIIFEYVHKALGYGALTLSIPLILTGLSLANAPRWMWLVICGWWVLLLLLVLKLQRAGRCFDTYQAIWGPDPDLPGNRRPPIGLAILREPAIRSRSVNTRR